MKINNLNKELLLVRKLLKNEIIEEEIISDLYDYIFKSSGKQIRARLSLLTSSIDKRKGEKRLRLAAIIELLHTATLVHDDVVDSSAIRRGNASVNSIWTNSHSVLIGDYIYSKAFMLMVALNDMKILKELSDATNDISKGELIQLDSINNIKVDLSYLLKISYFKTGRLFEAAAKSGAILAGGERDYIKHSTNFSKNLGVLFQIKDDLLDYQIDSHSGKPNFQDIKEKKITYPFYFAYTNASSKERRDLKDFLDCESINNEKLYELVSKLGGLEKTENLAISFLQKAEISAYSIKNKIVKDEMLNLLHKSLNRKK
ncbi:polyprenyl synthetase family protein [Gammaproteobacteria bacterium]|nr:polyprenyl synthetase family protein [Gammaproteobacteria bacterium]MDA9142952.1 polyprenyl synthetase family protein [Gammaproteobacteria bacterium]MDA9997787.1 polyprenyl synthetase family protein [Gammaproteobacteria bacterium]MDC1123595.1 polyprenyl synthetase family protein [Gammaproteobacteria bacterium]